jgi:hypothetical protein
MMPTPKLKFKLVDITPDMAKRYLHHNHSNRNIRKNKVAEYKKAMDKGYWRVTGEGISLDPEGKLLDGQHRLHAIIEHGKPVTMAVIRGVAPGAQQYMDSGIVRKTADNLKMFDGEKNTIMLTSASRALRLFDTGDFTSPLLDEVRAIIKKHRKSFDFMNNSLSKSLPRTAYFFAPLVWCHHHGWGDEAELFLNEMSTLEGLYKGSPVIALSKGLARKAGTSGQYYKSLSIATLTFNALRAYTLEEPLAVSKLLPSAKGFDYFNAQIKPNFDKKRTRSICSWKAGCTFKRAPKAGGEAKTYDYCWFHEHIRAKREKKE